ncbi:MAG: prolipoprotein diacylglyceryl transferase [Gammaproteobacteria bacterium]
MQYTAFDPVALQLGPLAVRWYGLMYLIGFVGGWWLVRFRARRDHGACTVIQVDDLLFYTALGVILGGRVGYMLFYNWGQLADDPLSLLRIWQGGMSFHGGFLGVLLAMWLFARKIGRGFWEITDTLAPVVPIGLGAGRIGNFINGELWGRPTDAWWGMQLDCRQFGDVCFGQLKLPPGTAQTPPLHPSSLYEACLEGFVLFIILWVFSSRPRPAMAVSGLFLLCYGVFRSGVEMVRMPDAHIDYLAFGWVTMGHVLTWPMIVGGLMLLWLAYRSRD